MRKGIIDIHAHILPGVDDGARDMGEALEMIRMAAAQGVTGIIATPHYSKRKGPKEQNLFCLVRELEQRVKERYPWFEVSLGQETYYHDGLAEHLKEERALTLAESRYVLTEFDPGVSYGTLLGGLRKLSHSGYQPILAHAERYRCLRDEKNLADLRGCGYWLQMYYESLEGPWYKADVRWCRRQIEEGRIQILGSDMHRTDWRAPRLEGALDWLENHVSQKQLRSLTWENPLKILEKQYEGNEKRD